MISYAHGTVGLVNRCAPSFRDDLPAFLGEYLKAGFAFVATDYEGLGPAGPHPYLNGKSEAYGQTDIVRAARQTTTGPVRVDVGYFSRRGGGMSGGTQASSLESIVEPSFAFRGGRLRGERTAARVRTFEIAGGKQRRGLSVEGSEHFCLPAVHPTLRDVEVALGMAGSLTPAMPIILGRDQRRDEAAARSRGPAGGARAPREGLDRRPRRRSARPRRLDGGRRGALRLRQAAAAHPTRRRQRVHLHRGTSLPGEP